MKLKILLLMIMTLVLMSFTFGAECELVGTQNYEKFAGANVDLSIVYSPIAGHNVTNISFYYPAYTSPFYTYNNSASDLSADVSVTTPPFELVAGLNYVYINATNINDTATANVQWECQKIKVLVGDSTVNNLLLPMILLLVGFALIIALVLYLKTGFKSGLNLGQLVYVIIGFIITLGIISGGFLALFR